MRLLFRKGRMGSPYLLVLLFLALLSVSCQNQSIRKLAASDAPMVLNVHVIPHTHDDVGWRKTVEQYYYGVNNTIDRRGAVHSIISSAIESLTEFDARTFTYAEVKFFSMWWEQQTESMQDTVRWLIANEQLTFVNGGWCMHDEATTHYMGMIDQTTLGHQFLLDNLGVVPKTAWQLDPFGHSSTQASLLSFKAGLDAIYFGRIDYQDLNLRRNASECEGIWNASQNSDSSIFWGLTGSYGGNYGPPEGFNFDVLFDDEQLITANTTMLQRRVLDFLDKIKVQSDQTKGNNIMLTMGTDFTYRQASVNFANTDLLIGSVMDFQRWGILDVPSIFEPRFDRVNIFYSNPDYYTQQKFRESRNRAEQTTKIDWPTKTDDFFPYSDCPNCFWTGYFTSRAAFKRFERVASAFLMAARQLAAQVPPSKENADALWALDDALGIAQHHDAVSGTAKQHVADDYSQKLSHGMHLAAQSVSGNVRNLMLSSPETLPLANLMHCPLLNETICSITEEATATNDTVVYAIVYNPLAQNRTAVVRLPVSSKAFFRVERVEEGGRFQLIKSESSDPVQASKNVLVFGTGTLPPLGAVAFRIVKEPNPIPFAPVQGSAVTSVLKIDQNTKRETIELSNGLLSAVFDYNNGEISEITSNGTTVPVKQTYGYYTSFDSARHCSNNSSQNSGAYIFRPSSPKQQLIPLDPKSAVFVNTSVGIEVHTTFQVSWLKQIIRVYSDEPFIESEYTVGPIPIADSLGKEIVTRFTSPIQNNGTYFTDSNGREFQKRRRNTRSSWDLNIFEPVAGNFYPVTTAIYIEDATKSLAVCVDRSQGGGSLEDGSLELMMQRRILADDARGVDEALNETSEGMTAYPPFGDNQRRGDGVVVRGKYRVVVGSGMSGAALSSSQMDSIYADTVVLVGSVSSSNPATFENASFSGIQSALPKNVALLTFSRRSKTDQFLVRLGHQYGPSVDVDLSVLFPSHNVSAVTEKTLGASQDWQERMERRLVWAHPAKLTENDMPKTKVTLARMEIRTFEVTVSMRHEVEKQNLVSS